MFPSRRAEDAGSLRGKNGARAKRRASQKTLRGSQGDGSTAGQREAALPAGGHHSTDRPAEGRQRLPVQTAGGALDRFGPLAIGQPSAHVGNAAQTARDRRWRHAVLRSERITPRVGRQGG